MEVVTEIKGKALAMGVKAVGIALVVAVNRFAPKGGLPWIFSILPTDSLLP